jgi:peptidoglycan/LPS O-acetylase OafA/YrhL
MATTTGRIPGLDGLRGLAILMVLLFHFWPNLLPGGFLGVSLFFTLSGFLITRILLSEMETYGRVDYRRFLRRRVRRLMPAALATLVLVVTVWSLSGWLTAELTREAVWSALNVANWQRIASGEAYGSVAENSPVLHFWSLAVEEQVYFLLPLLVIACRRRRVAAWMLSILVAASTLYTLNLDGETTLAYYSTFSRAGEMLVGAAAAAWMPARLRGGYRTSGVAVGAFLLTLPLGGTLVSLGTAGVYRGGLILYALGSAVGLIGIMCTPGAGRLLDVAPLSWLGRTSYGIYLFHWPIYVYLQGTPLDARLVPLTAVGLTLGLAAVSRYRFEEPLLRGALPSWRLGGVLGLLLVVPFASLTWAAPAAGIDFEAAEVRLQTLITENGGGDDGEHPTSTTVTSMEASGSERVSVKAPVLVGGGEETLRIGVFGDSKALTLALGLDSRNSDIVLGTSFSGMGCPLGRNVVRRESPDTPAVQYDRGCDWSRRIIEEADGAVALDVALVWYGTWDVREVRVDGIDGWTSIDDAAYRAWLREEMATLTDLIAVETGAKRVVWLTVYPDPAFGRSGRFELYNDMLAELATSHEVAEVADLAGWLEGTGEVSRLLPDFIHPSFDASSVYGNTSGEIARRFLNNVLMLPAP